MPETLSDAVGHCEELGLAETDSVALEQGVTVRLAHDVGVRLEVTEGLSVPLLLPLLDTEGEVVCVGESEVDMEGVVVAQGELERDWVGVPLAQLLPEGEGEPDTVGVTERVGDSVALMVGDVDWDGERLSLRVPVTVLVPLLQ